MRLGTKGNRDTLARALRWLLGHDEDKTFTTRDFWEALNLQSEVHARKVMKSLREHGLVVDVGTKPPYNTILYRSTIAWRGRENS